MADVRDLYDGIIAPQGGLYKPQGAGVYDGIVPKSSSGLNTRSVQTVPINPFTGNPVGVADALKSPQPTQQQLQAIRAVGPSAPPNEVMVPGGSNTAHGYQSGQTFPDSYRLLPTGPLAIAGSAAQAAETAAAPSSSWAGRGITLPAGLAGMRAPQPRPMDNGVFGVPMSSGMASILSNDPVYAPQRAAGTAQPAPVMRPSQAALALADSIRGGAKPGTNTIMRTINQSESPDASREAIGQAMGDQIRKSATPSKTATGSDNRFMPKSVQNSVRFQTGY